MKKIIFVICLMIMGCPSEEAKREALNNKIDYNVTQLSLILEYYKDTRTNVCYSAAYGGFNGNIFTSVLCTPEVEEVAHKFRSSAK